MPPDHGGGADEARDGAHHEEGAPRGQAGPGRRGHRRGVRPAPGYRGDHRRRRVADRGAGGVEGASVILLDTHALVWLVAEPARLSRAATDAIRRARSTGGLAVASITLWELAMLLVRGHVRGHGTVDALDSAGGGRCARLGAGDHTGNRCPVHAVPGRLPARPGGSPHRRDGAGGGVDARDPGRADPRERTREDRLVSRATVRQSSHVGAAEVPR